MLLWFFFFFNYVMIIVFKICSRDHRSFSHAFVDRTVRHISDETHRKVVCTVLIMCRSWSKTWLSSRLMCIVWIQSLSHIIYCRMKAAAALLIVWVMETLRCTKEDATKIWQFDYPRTEYEEAECLFLFMCIYIFLFYFLFFCIRICIGHMRISQSVVIYVFYLLVIFSKMYFIT